MFQIQFITHFTDRISYSDAARIALEGGCRWIQLRMKDASDAQVEETARELLPLCKAAQAVFILDDRVELALKLGADGVHLGRNDMPVKEARRLAGKDFIIGGTANTLEDIRRIHAEGADYIGCGPFRYTTTKARLAPILGEEGYRRLTAAMKREGIGIPMVGIGGVTAEDIPLLKDCGLNGIALSGSVLRAPDPVLEMQRIIKITNHYK